MPTLMVMHDSDALRPAILGGRPTLTVPIPRANTMGPEEADAVRRVVDGGILSDYLGAWSPEFHGGSEVRAFEGAWAERMGVRHALAVNSATSGLIAAMGALAISPGDEVIVPPLTMSATAMAPLFYGGIPVFADVEAETCSLDPQAVRAALSPRTKAIVVVNLFGHPARLAELRAIADAHGCALVEDNSQSPLAHEHGALAGTVGHLGIFSLNYHKHVHTGEGGFVVTDDDDLARRVALIRNHGENAVGPLGLDDVTNLIGFNFRLTELQAAIGRVQLTRLDDRVERLIGHADRLSAALDGLPGLTVPVVRPGCRHVYYGYAIRYRADVVGLSRAAFGAALAAEGVPHALGYVDPLYRLPVFRRRRAIGRDGWPFSLGAPSYADGTCPVAERLHGEEYILFEICTHALDDTTVDAVAAAFRKVYAHRDELAAANLAPAADEAELVP